jgi:6-phosphogluconolactonase
MDEMWLYVGTYTDKGAKGIYIYCLDQATGGLKAAGLVTGVRNPSFLAIGPQQRCLYAVQETAEFEGQPGGGVSAFAIDRATGALTRLNSQRSHGVAPCHLTVDRTGQYVLVANYGSGSVSVLPIVPDGALGEATDVVQHHGSSVDPARQEGPHAHSVTLGPDNRYAFVADLGLDRVMSYRLDLAQGKLEPNDPPWVEVHAGAGPRHMAFHPSYRHAYVIHELDSTLSVFAYDRARGALKEVQNVSTLPGDFNGQSYCADVHVEPAGRFVYGSNRGHDSIALFAIDAQTGQVTPAGHQSTQGQTPRNFAIDPSGRWLLAANQDSDTVVVFRIDAQTGQLAPTGHVTRVPAPVCLKLLPRA